ncbi:unnamed protein product [Diamesa tonsa]
MDLKAVMTKISPLQQLLEDINFQRTKEMRNLMKDDSGFVVLQGNTFWTEIFVRHFLFQTQKESIDSDDLLFFVRKKYVKTSARNMPKYETEIEVFRKDSKKLPIGDPDVDWEETVYLNLVIHQFDYYLTLAICTRTSPKELQVLRRHSQRVYASPSRRKMDSKGDSEEITYPHICFMVDNFDEVFQDILVRDGEMVCVELVAKDHDGTIQGVIFLGSIRYDALKKVYDARQSSLSSKISQRMTFGLFNSGPQTRCEFVRMKGPAGKGFAEMAVTKPKGSGIETPTSEPGFCATDMWDSECEDELDEYLNTRHQRRLSDPSSNLNNFSKNGWRTKNTTQNTNKALSQNEGLDCMANEEANEIEAGNLRDDNRPASSASDTKLAKRKDQDVTLVSPSSCCNPIKITTKCTSNQRESIQLSDMYSPATTEPEDSPSCLTTITKQKPQSQVKTLLNVESEIEYSKNFNKKITYNKKVNESNTKSPKHKVKGNQDEYEIAYEAADEVTVDEKCTEIGVMTEIDKKFMIRVNGKEELPCVENTEKIPIKTETTSTKKPKSRLNFLKPKITNDIKLNSVDQCLSNNNIITNNIITTTTIKKERDGETSDDNNNSDDGKAANIKFSTLPMVNKNKHKRTISIPQRTTADGTQIFYICDVPKKLQKELDDGQYNPLWTSKGFSQTFHFWKENKRQSSTPLNAFLTYVTLPWFSIAKDLLDHREMPILTF